MFVFKHIGLYCFILLYFILNVNSNLDLKNILYQFTGVIKNKYNSLY